MDWLRHAWFDIGITVVVILATFGDMEAARWVIIIYSPFMVLLKLVAFGQRHKPSKFKTVDAGVPDAVYHVLYGANVLMTAYDRWWWISGCWVVIWVLSWAIGKGSEGRKAAG